MQRDSNPTSPHDTQIVETIHSSANDTSRIKRSQQRWAYNVGEGLRIAIYEWE
eukprot:COSAG02_NODE_44214_length_368_cov_0.657993_1_plen_52_part_10